jgi:hypothetical protein
MSISTLTDLPPGALPVNITPYVTSKDPTAVSQGWQYRLSRGGRTTRRRPRCQPFGLAVRAAISTVDLDSILIIALVLAMR